MWASAALSVWISRLNLGSETFGRMFGGLHESKRVQVNLWACSERCNMNVVAAGGGWSESRLLGRWTDAWVNDLSLTGEELMTVMAHELVHAAVNAGRAAKTGISCEKSETTDQCTDRWTEVIRKELRDSERDSEKKKKGPGGKP